MIGKILGRMHMLFWKAILTNWQNMKAKETSKVPIFKLFSELGKIS